MEKAFIKRNGVVKEVLISAVACEYDKETKQIIIKSTKCLHQGEEIGWGKRTYYKDKLCTELFDITKLECIIKAGDGGVQFKFINLTFTCHYNDNGARSVVTAYMKEIQFTNEKTLNANVILSNCDDDSTLNLGKVFWSQKTYDWYNETTIHHNDGTIEVFGGNCKQWEFNEKQQALLKQFMALQGEMKQNNIRLLFDSDDCCLYAINEEKEEIAINDPYGNGEDIEGCSEWKEVPTMAYKNVVNGWSFLNCDSTIHFRKREDIANNEEKK